MVNILVPSASHLLTDHLLSSEGITCYNLFQKLERFGYHFEAISTQINIKKPLTNTTLHQIGSFQTSPTMTPIKKYLNHAESLINSYRKSMEILQKQKIDIIHHMLPAVYNQTFSLLSILGRNSQPFVFGPISAHIYPRPLDEKMLSRITSKLHKKTIQNCSKLITITNQVKNVYSKIFDEEKIHTIPLGVDTELFKPVKKGTKTKNLEILFAGFLYKLKGAEYLLKATQLIAKRHRDVKLRIVGQGPDKQYLLELAEALKIKENVTFEGLVPHTEMPKYYQQCDVFCFPTLGEPFGKAIIEAMACAKPVVASNIGGPSEIIQDQKTGLLVPPAQPEILATKILALLDNEAEMKKMGTNARKTVMEKYSWIKIAEKYHALYDSLI